MKNHRISIMLILATILLLSACGRKTVDKPYTSVIEGESLQVPSLTGGIIKELRVIEGNWVEAGDTLALLDTREYLYQIEQLDASLNELEMQSKIAGTNISQAQQDLQFTQERTDRLRAIYKVQGLSLQELENAENLLHKSQSAEANFAAQHQMLTASKARLMAQKKILVKKIADTIITAPCAGMVSTLFYQQGEAITPFGNLLELIDVRNVSTRIYVSEALLAKLQTGQKVNVKIAEGTSLPGEIAMISDKAEFTPKTILTPDTRSAMVYAVKISIANPNKILKAGMPVDVRL